jgi:NADPH:quinone reductase-like Zn-dependent oxidoreductase
VLFGPARVRKDRSFCVIDRPGSRSYAAAMTGIEGKVVAITGASSGIGEATALLLAERGAKVVLGASTGSPQGSGHPHRECGR